MYNEASNRKMKLAITDDWAQLPNHTSTQCRM